MFNLYMEKQRRSAVAPSLIFYDLRALYVLVKQTCECKHLAIRIYLFI